MYAQRRMIRPHGDRLSRSEPFELFTRPQRSKIARVLGLVIRLRAELTTAVVAWVGWHWLSDRIPPWAAITLLALAVITVASVPATRRYVVNRAYAVWTRYRLRAVFVERRIMNYSGNVPILLWSRPTAVGERVVLALRAGIDLRDLEANLSYIASGCWGRDARVSAHRANTAFVVLQVIRRNPLAAASLGSTLTDRSGPRQRLQLVPTPKGA